MQYKSEIEYIAENNGIKNQLLKLVEEMAEVTQEISKLMISKEDKEVENIYHEKLTEELADLAVVLHGVIYLMDNAKEINEHRRYKALRQLRRIRDTGKGGEPWQKEVEVTKEA